MNKIIQFQSISKRSGPKKPIKPKFKERETK